MTQLQEELAAVLDDPQLDDADKIEAVRRTVEARRPLTAAENAAVIEQMFGKASIQAPPRPPAPPQSSSSAASASGTDDKWLTPGEAAEYANVCTMTIWRWRNEEGMNSVKIGGVVRIRRSELQKFMERHIED
jgi:excisionase family DNA binding protein